LLRSRWEASRTRAGEKEVVMDDEEDSDEEARFFL
jgi:hypothetical protein